MITVVHLELPEQQIGGTPGIGWQTSFFAQQIPFCVKVVPGGQPQSVGLLGLNTMPLGQQPTGPADEKTV